MDSRAKDACSTMKTLKSDYRHRTEIMLMCVICYVGWTMKSTQYFYRCPLIGMTRGRVVPFIDTRIWTFFARWQNFEVVEQPLAWMCTDNTAYSNMLRRHISLPIESFLWRVFPFCCCAFSTWMMRLLKRSSLVTSSIFSPFLLVEASTENCWSGM